MKILLVGSFDPGDIGNYFVKGLKKLQLHPEIFDITTDYYPRISKSTINKIVNKIRPETFYNPINKKLLQFINGKRYDIILVIKGLTLYPSTVQEIKSYTKVIACYNADHPFHFFSEGSGNKNIKDSIPFYDVYFSYSKNIVSDLKNKYGIASYQIPFGYDATLSGVRTEVNNSGKIVFIGAYDSARAALLEDLYLENLVIFGEEKWGSRTGKLPNIKKAYQGRPIFAADYASSCASAAGVLNFLRKQNLIESSHNMRTFEVPGYGGVLVANRTAEQMEFFEDGKEAIYFDTIEELKDKIKFLGSNIDYSDKIKKAAYQRCMTSNYSYDHRSAQMLSFLRQHIN